MCIKRKESGQFRNFQAIYKEGYWGEDMANTERRIQQRKRMRMLASCLVDWKKAAPLYKFVSFTKDVSAHGAHLVARGQIRKGDRFAVRLELPTSFFPLMVCSEVMWAREVGLFKNSQKKTMEAGVRFLNLDAFDQDRLRFFLAQKGVQLREEQYSSSAC